MVDYFEFIKQRDKRYVSWNILFLWGFGLWIALCTTILFSEEYWNSELAYIVSETETTANLMKFKTTNCTLCDTSLQLNTVIRNTCVLLSACLSLVFLCIRERITKIVKILNNVTRNTYSKPDAKDRSDYMFKIKSRTRNSRYILQSKLVIHYELVSQDLQKIFAHEKLEKFRLKECIVQSRIMFNYSAFFIFNNYEIYSHFNNQLFQSIWDLMIISKILNSKQTKRLCLNNNRNVRIKRNLRKRIISSSPEFQEFLSNLRSQI